MSSNFWILMLIIILAIVIFITIGIIIYYRVMNRLRNGFVARIFNADFTIKTYRFDEIPQGNKFFITEKDHVGGEVKKEYDIKEECIYKGNWGKYSDYDYGISIPINPKDRTPKGLLNDVKELFSHIGSLLDTDLHIKLLRNSKFEDFVRIMLMCILIGMCITAILGGISTFKAFQGTSHASNQNCVLNLDNKTWETIYIASHQPSPSTVTVGEAKR